MRAETKRNIVAGGGSLAFVATLIALTYPPRSQHSAEGSAARPPATLLNTDSPESEVASHRHENSNFRQSSVAEEVQYVEQDVSLAGMRVTKRKMPWLEKECHRLNNLGLKIDREAQRTILHSSRKQEFLSRFERLAQTEHDIHSYGVLVGVFTELREYFEQTNRRREVENPIGLEYMEAGVQKKMYFDITWEGLVRMEKELERSAPSSGAIEWRLNEVLLAVYAIEEGRAKPLYSFSAK